MIVRSHPAGHSFKWLATYLTHDPKAQSSERVEFTHTLNLAFDDPGSAVDTMLRTYRAREILKKQAGIRPGGSSVVKPVKHVSLSWHPSEKPDKEAMIAAAQSYLRAMGWQDMHCLIVGHSDKHPHVHLMLNAIHPERGMRLDDRFERRKAQNWALTYEQERGKVHCAERLKPVAERQPSPPRNVWQELRRLDAGPIPSRRKLAEIDYAVPAHLWRRQEWTVLKERQRDERISFFEDLVGYYRVYRQQLYKTTGASFRREWAAYFKSQRAGLSADALKVMKDGIVGRQKERYREAVHVASPKMREERDRVYTALLARQQAERAKLTDRQELGRRSPDLVRHGSPQTVTPPRYAAPATLPSARPHPPGRPFVWSSKARMVAQQRSAERWLDRALDRIRREARPVPQTAPSRNRLAEARERLAEGQPDRKQKTASIGIEPDGSGGSGM